MARASSGGIRSTARRTTSTRCRHAHPSAGTMLQLLLQLSSGVRMQTCCMSTDRQCSAFRWQPAAAALRSSAQVHACRLGDKSTFAPLQPPLLLVLKLTSRAVSRHRCSWTSGRGTRRRWTRCWGGWTAAAASRAQQCATAGAGPGRWRCRWHSGCAQGLHGSVNASRLAPQRHLLPVAKIPYKRVS